MAWSNSKIFGQFLLDAFGNTSNFDLDSGADVLKAALYDTDVTPDETVSAANSAYNAGQWVASGNELTHANWAAGGRTIASSAVTKAGATGSHYVMLDGTDTAGAGTVTMSGILGCLVYDSTATAVTNQGVCYNYFGGAQSVTGGTFTIVWHANGIFRITV